MTAMIPAWVNGTLQPVEKLAVHQRGLRHLAVSVFVMDGDKFPPVLSLGVTFALILGGIFFSLWKTRGEETSGPSHIV